MVAACSPSASHTGPRPVTVSRMPRLRAISCSMVLRKNGLEHDLAAILRRQHGLGDRQHQRVEAGAHDVAQLQAARATVQAHPRVARVLGQRELTRTEP
jgi:hypothetical protein